MAQQDPDSDDQLFHGERFQQVIIAAAVEAAYPVVYAVAGGQDQDRRFNSSVPPCPQHVQPVGIGKAQVEDNGAVFCRRPGGLAAAGGIDGVNGEAFLFQAVLYEFGKPFVIFDQ